MSIESMLILMLLILPSISILTASIIISVAIFKSGHNITVNISNDRAQPADVKVVEPSQSRKSPTAERLASNNKQDDRLKEVVPPSLKMPPKIEGGFGSRVDE